MTPEQATRADNPVVELIIDDVAYGGRGVGRHEGCAVFVPGVLRGERVRARIAKAHPRFMEAELASVLESSSDRIEPVCPLAVRALDAAAAPCPACPGCAYQHASYDSEVREKNQQLDALLERLGKLAGMQRPPARPAPRPLGYRNKIVLHPDLAGATPRLGYVAADNRTVVPIAHCPLAVPKINALLSDTLADAELMGSLEPRDRVTLRHTETDGALAWTGRARGRLGPFHEQTAFGEFFVPADSFWQVNPAVGNELLQAVQALVEERAPRQVADLYCGVGAFAIVAALSGAPHVLGVDSDRQAVQAAQTNAVDRDLDGVEFRVNQVDSVAGDMLAALPADRALVVLDPPRRGLGKPVVRALATHRPRTVVYISCAPDTLARDLNRLCDQAYRLHSCRVLDMFPRTASFEVLAVLEAT